jgi:hypothetical protein
MEGAGEPAAGELRQALDEAQARVPDDVTLRRMWAHVAEPLLLRRRRAPRWLWFVSGVGSTAALAFACALALWPHAQPPATRPAVEPHATLMTPGTVRTGAGETLALALRGGAEAHLGSSSAMTLDATDRLAVDGGDVRFTVPHQPHGHTFTVNAGPYRVVVIGTKFRLRLDEAHHVALTVDEGVVEVWDRTRLARVVPGESWSSPAQRAAAQAETPAVEQPPIAPAHAHHVARPHLVALATPAATPATAAPTAAEGTPDPAAQARAALAAGDVQKALALYRALAARGGPAGENAEYELAKILRDRLGQPLGALAAWRRYRSEHPDGILRIETDVSIIETLVHIGESDAALSEAADFLRRHPDSERRAEIARVAGDLYRTRGDCRQAIGAYQTALSSAHAAGAAEAASFHRASCLVQLGDPTGADAARGYLRAWPAGRFRAEAARLLAATSPGPEEAPRP